MRAYASSFAAWAQLEAIEGVKVPHGLVFPLAVVAAIGAPHGLTLDAEEHHAWDAARYDSIFISVLDSRCLMNAATHFRRWGVPFRRRDRPAGHPLVWVGGQGMHNPMPLADVADLIVIGDAEAPLPALLALWERHGNTPGFLAAAATVPGVFVPAHHDPREVRIRQSVADDISITLRSPISVSHDGTRRLEIARGCQYKCTFCSLGWRAPVRENPAPAVVAEIRRSPKRVHLQAGDAESHSGIAEIRAALRAMGGLDTGWTGRLDTLLENPDQSIPSQKRYAFGVEGVSFRLRRAVGKGYLTDERLISDTVRFLDSIEGDGVGRAAWHLIAGLPTERPEESLQLLAVLREIEHRRRGRTPRILSLHWQPFQPLPGTPMQWCPSGTGAHRQAAFMRAAEGWGALRVRQHGGRHDATAQLCAVLARSDARGANLLELLATRRRVSLADAERVTGMTAGALDVDAPLPWDFIDHAYPRATLARAYHAMMRRLTAPPDDSPADHPEPTACLA